MSGRNTGKLADPQFRIERASKAGYASNSADALIRRLAKLQLTAEHRLALAQLARGGAADAG